MIKYNQIETWSFDRSAAKIWVSGVWRYVARRLITDLKRYELLA